MVKGRRQTADGRRWRVVALLPFAFCLLPLFANELSVDRTTLNLDDSLTIIVALDGAFTGVDSVNVPVQNLRIIGNPSVSSQISWINGTLTQRKVFRFQARPIGPGGGLVGPLVIESRDGQRETLSPVAVQILPDLASGSNDPQLVLRELLATRRDPFFVIAEADRASALVGEEIVVTWTLYNAATVEQWEIGNVPKLADFWSEELDVRNERPETIMIGPNAVQKLVIRRVALFPLHAGTATVGPLEARAEIMRRVDLGGGFGNFEGSMIDVTRHSAPLSINVQAIPAGPPVDVVGDVALNCGKATQANGGPVVIDVGLSGRANLRTVEPPHWAAPLAGSAQVEQGKLTVTRGADAATMSRKWKLLVFPTRDGAFKLPPLVTRAFSPTAARQELRCEAVTLNVHRHPERSRGTREGGGAQLSPKIPPALIPTTVVIALVLLTVPLILRASKRSNRIRALAHPINELRPKLAALLAEKQIDEAQLLKEPTERGDAYRSLLSLLDAIDRQRVEIDDPDREVEFRLHDFLQFLK